MILDRNRPTGRGRAILSLALLAGTVAAVAAAVPSADGVSPAKAEGPARATAPAPVAKPALAAKPAPAAAIVADDASGVCLDRMGGSFSGTVGEGRSSTERNDDVSGDFTLQQNLGDGRLLCARVKGKVRFDERTGAIREMPSGSSVSVETRGRHQGAIGGLEAGRWQAGAPQRARIDEEITTHRAALQRKIEGVHAEEQIGRLERQIADLHAEDRIAEIERRMTPALDRLKASIARLGRSPSASLFAQSDGTAEPGPGGSPRSFAGPRQSGASTFSGSTPIEVAGYNEICARATTLACIPEPPPVEKVDGLADRVMFRLAYRNFGDHEALVRPENGQRCPEADAQGRDRPSAIRAASMA